MLKTQYVTEKQAFENILVQTRMTEVTYSETFNLIFSKVRKKGAGENYNWLYSRWNLIIDAAFWVGEEKELIKMLKINDEIIEMDDENLASRLVGIRYNNLIQVQKVEFFEKYLCIYLDENMVLAIAYCCDSDYAWILEEYNDKKHEEKTRIICQENELFARNIF